MATASYGLAQCPYVAAIICGRPLRTTLIVVNRRELFDCFELLSSKVRNEIGWLNCMHLRSTN